MYGTQADGKLAYFQCQRGMDGLLKYKLEAEDSMGIHKIDVASVAVGPIVPSTLAQRRCLSAVIGTIYLRLPWNVVCHGLQGEHSAPAAVNGHLAVANGAGTSKAMRRISNSRQCVGALSGRPRLSHA